MNFLSDAMADFEGLLEVNRNICKGGRDGGKGIAYAADELCGIALTLYGIQRWQVAAALSAAVTITKPQETAPNAQAEPTKKKHTRQTPAALRERGSGGEALLSEKRPLPRISPQSIFGREREKRGLFKEKPPPSQS